MFLNAKFIITSSFHGTAFAINFEIPFISIVPNKEVMDSRIKSLLLIMGLECQAITTRQPLPNKLPLSIDYSTVRMILSEYRYRSECFLRKIVETDF